MARWWTAPRSLRGSLRLLRRGVDALEALHADHDRLHVDLARIAEALEAGVILSAEARGADSGLTLAEEVPVPSLQQVLATAAATPVLYSPASGRTFRTAPPGRPTPAEPTEAVGGVAYRDSATLLRAWQVEQQLTLSLGRGPSEQELADALAVEEGRGAAWGGSRE